MNLNQRHTEPEIMDDLALSGEAMGQTLKEIDFINKVLGGNGATLEGVKRLLEKSDHTGKIMLLDLGCGSGEMLIQLAKWARKKGVEMELHGIDANAYIVDYAQKHTAAFPEIKIWQANIFDEAAIPDQHYQILTATLFLHHFTQEELINFFEINAKKASMGWVINDLHRQFLAYWLIKILTRLFSKSYLVKNDAPLSVARAFRKHDWYMVFNSVKMHYELRWRWAFRWLVIVKN